MNMMLCKKGVKLQKHIQFRHAGPRSGTPCLYQRLEISLVRSKNERIRCGMTPFLNYNTYISPNLTILYRAHANLESDVKS